MPDTELERFTAVDATGRRYTIIVDQQWLVSGDTVTAGLRRAYALDDQGKRRSVSMENDGRFLVFGDPLLGDEPLIPVTRL